MALAGADRLLIAAKIGSDVPLFLLGGLVLGLSRGEAVYPFPDLPVTPCVVAVPSLGVSTAAAFRALDQRMAAESLAPWPSGSLALDPALTPGPNPSKLETLSRALSAAWSPSGAHLGMSFQTTSEIAEPSPSGITRQPGDRAENALLALVRTGIENDFEEVVFQQNPSLRSIKRDLVGDSTVPEGSRALYAALSGSGSALFGLYRSTADAQAAQQRVQSSGTQAFLTETLPRPEYWNTMLEI